jgi:hypothetical protein
MGNLKKGLLAALYKSKPNEDISGGKSLSKSIARTYSTFRNNMGQSWQK